MRRLGRGELAALIALAGLSLLVLAALLTKGRALTGADGLLASDQLQYFTWIRQAGEHGLIGNEYDLAPDHRVFLHPGLPALRTGLELAGPHRSAELSAVEAGRRRPAVLGRAALCATAAAGGRRAHLRAAARAVCGDAGERAGGLDRVRRQAAPVHVRLHRRRARLCAVSLGLSDDRDRGGVDAARAARGRGLAVLAPEPDARARRGGRASGDLAATVAGSNAGPGDRRHRGAHLAADAGPTCRRDAGHPHRGVRARDLLRDPGADGRRLGARRTGQRGREPGDLELALVGDRALARATRRPSGAELPPRDPRMARDRRADLAVRRAADLPRAGGHVPVPRVPGHVDPARSARRPGRPLGLGAAVPLARGDRAVR